MSIPQSTSLSALNKLTWHSINSFKIETRRFDFGDAVDFYLLALVSFLRDKEDSSPALYDERNEDTCMIRTIILKSNSEE